MLKNLGPTGPMILAIAMLSGCSQTAAPSGQSAAAADAQVASSSQETGAQLWAENCSRCHNYRNPQSFSATQWHAIVHHMRLRANLTGEEQRKITEFLQSNN